MTILITRTLAVLASTFTLVAFLNPLFVQATTASGTIVSTVGTSSSVAGTIGGSVGNSGALSGTVTGGAGGGGGNSGGGGGGGGGGGNGSVLGSAGPGDLLLTTFPGSVLGATTIPGAPNTGQGGDVLLNWILIVASALGAAALSYQLMTCKQENIFYRS